MIITKQLRILDRMLLLKFQSMKIPIEPTAGMSARVPFTTEFTIFLDYDNIKDDRLREELVYLQEVYGLGDFLVLSTNEFGRHAICLDRDLIACIDLQWSASEGPRTLSERLCTPCKRTLFYFNSL